MAFAWLTMRRRLSRFRNSQHGGAMLELAVAFPILLLVTMAVADYARVYYTGITVANAAIAGAHYGVATNKGIKVDSMKMAAQLDAGSVTLDSVAAGQFCSCPGTGIVACVGTDCGAYGLPQVYDSVWVKKDVALYIRYVGLPSTVTVTRTAILREK
jgi:hypothetical protein